MVLYVDLLPFKTGRRWRHDRVVRQISENAERDTPTLNKTDNHFVWPHKASLHDRKRQDVGSFSGIWRRIAGSSPRAISRNRALDSLTLPPTDGKALMTYKTSDESYNRQHTISTFSSLPSGRNCKKIPNQATAGKGDSDQKGVRHKRTIFTSAVQQDPPPRGGAYT